MCKIGIDRDRPVGIKGNVLSRITFSYEAEVNAEDDIQCQPDYCKPLQYLLLERSKTEEERYLIELIFESQLQYASLVYLKLFGVFHVRLLLYHS